MLKCLVSAGNSVNRTRLEPNARNQAELTTSEYLTKSAEESNVIEKQGREKRVSFHAEKSNTEEQFCTFCRALHSGVSFYFHPLQRA